MKIALIGLALLAYLFFTTSVLLYDPKIWPDEVYLSDIAQNFNLNGKMGTNLWGDMHPGTKDHVFWYPPLYPFSLSLAFKTFGFSILTQRYLSIFIGGSLLITLFILLGKIGKLHLSAIFILALLVIDHAFLKASRMGRVEIFLLFFGSVALIIYKLRYKFKKETFVYFCSGFLCGLAIITHIWGAIFVVPILINSLLEKKVKALGIALIALFVPVALWLISIYPNYPIFFKQLELQGNFREIIRSHFLFTFQQTVIEYKLTLTIYLLLTMIATIFAFRLKLFRSFCIVMLLGWIIYILGELEWYIAYFVPFLYFLGALIISRLLHSKSKTDKFLSFFLIFLFIILSFLNSKVYFKLLGEYDQYQRSYNKLLNSVTSYIPKGSTVYLSSIPDLYFSLKDSYQLYEFPTFMPDIDKYIEILDKSDFIIINYHLEKGFIGQLLIRYIEKNAKEERAFIESENNTLSIIKLKPQNERVY